MKFLKTTSLFPLLFLGLFALILGSCEMATSGETDSTDVTDTEVTSTETPGNETESAPSQPQEIHTFDRSETYIDAAHFGHFDLAHMEKKGENEGAAIYATENGKRTLEVTEIDNGEKGFVHTQVLKDREGKIEKKRVFNFETEPEKKLVEQIYDYQANQLWSREEKVDKDFSDLNGLPKGIIHGKFNMSEIK